MTHFELLIASVRGECDRRSKAQLPTVSVSVIVSPTGVRMRLVENVTEHVIQHSLAADTETAARLLCDWLRMFGWD